MHPLGGGIRRHDEFRTGFRLQQGGIIAGAQQTAPPLIQAAEKAPNQGELIAAFSWQR
jgi:hypothetical protein